MGRGDVASVYARTCFSSGLGNAGARRPAGTHARSSAEWTGRAFEQDLSDGRMALASSPDLALDFAANRAAPWVALSCRGSTLGVSNPSFAKDAHAAGHAITHTVNHLTQP